MPSAPRSFTTEQDPSHQSWTAVVAAETDITTATNMPATRRPVNERDPRAGPPIDSLLLRHPSKLRICVTINELLHITVIPPSESSQTRPPPSSVCGPGTIFIDYAMRYATSNQLEHDHDAAYSSRGKIHHHVVKQFLENNDYSIRTPPLSMATEMFGHHEAQGVIDECLFLGMSDYDMIATITRITAENIVRQYRRIVATYCKEGQEVDEIFICGPGARNTDIIDHLEESLPEEITTRPLDDIGIPGDAKEAVCCAQLGLEMVLKCALSEDEPLNTNNHNASGSIVRGKHWKELRDHVVCFSDGKELPAIQRIVVNRSVA